MTQKKIKYSKHAGGFTMTAAITWLTEMEQALSKAKEENKPILLDFFNPQ